MPIEGIPVVAKAAVAVLAALLAACRAQPVLEVELNGPVEEIRGVDWPRYEDGRRQDVAWFKGRTHVRLRLPGGQMVESVSYGTWVAVPVRTAPGEPYSVANEGDPVERVSLLPLSETVTPRELPEAMERVGEDLGLSNLAGFRESVAVARKGQNAEKCSVDASFAGAPGPGVKAVLRIRGHGDDGERCYISAEFWAASDASEPPSPSVRPTGTALPA